MRSISTIELWVKWRMVSEPNGFSTAQRSLSLVSGRSFDEYLADVPPLTLLLRRRLHEIRIPVAEQDFFINYPDTLHFVVVVSDDSPETVAVAPVLAAIAQRSPRFSLQILRDTDDLSDLARLAEEIDLLGIMTELGLPLLLIFDEEGNFQGQWGPHPQEAERYLDAWFEAHPEYDALAESDDPAAQARFVQLLDELTFEMRTWYNSGLNRACISEIRALLAGLLEDEAPEEELQDA